eukprot:TRINITY_DN23560_c0_g1_i1.p1 TRINITY_DN23560_c0_g1~~TRINITY_DN23560_c0_g1_i1.p1  ORF type:complete len:104 (-),score=14.70 TRINITY_DN23560_c0_g1_i1:21-332(-)
MCIRDSCIRNAEEIHESFLEGCVALSQVDLGPLSVVGGGCPVVSIGPKFLAGSGIRTLDLSPLCTIAEIPVSYTHLRAHETPEHLVCRLLLEKKKTLPYYTII